VRPDVREVTLEQASRNLPDLVTEAVNGEDVVIVQHGQPVVRLTPLPRKGRPVFGSAGGQIKIAPDFDAPIPGFEEYGG
jgi:prevent-host-death family protein